MWNGVRWQWSGQLDIWTNISMYNRIQIFHFNLVRATMSSVAIAMWISFQWHGTGLYKCRLYSVGIMKRSSYSDHSQDFLCGCPFFWRLVSKDGGQDCNTFTIREFYYIVWPSLTVILVKSSFIECSLIHGLASNRSDQEYGISEPITA